MASKIKNTTLFLDELVEVFFHKSIYYIPSEIIPENAKDAVRLQIKLNYFDQYYFADNELGFSAFNNNDAKDLNSNLIGKRAFLEQNTFKLIKKKKKLEFLAIIEKYYEYLMLFIDFTEWLITNIKKYNGENVDLSIIGAFQVQHQFFIKHLKDICNYFGELLNLEKDFNFTVGLFVFEYLPDILSRYSKMIENRDEVVVQNEINKKELKQKKSEDTNQEIIKKQSKKLVAKKVKEKPQLDLDEIESMILINVFNVDKAIINTYHT
ncbi:hypothetical protein SAMN06265371_104178 [Lutibacter agarilyticus]|uniref:Uncharacterized protein n=1 Tax=Lutibacter agarilyticus TaxID=1109740 RepID=A0A238WYZ6_9FLAO|nr:hypothetical protein [Lutibacter agarilyticus]SNR51444.1 hypothetical protein SAMN06265371_104178 [Lutibacter agarilyticus]